MSNAACTHLDQIAVRELPAKAAKTACGRGKWLHLRISLRDPVPSAVKTFSVVQRPPEEGTGVVAALDASTGRPLWTRKLPSAPFACATVASDVVFTPTYDGWIYALSARSGEILWSDRTEAGINGCPSVAGDTLLVPAGAPHRGIAHPVPQLVAYRLSGAGA